jgi:ElaB/YqjD/DUF883 family membrane-anchored ribosome-binding protein
MAEKKWYNAFVSFDEEAAPVEEAAAPQAVRPAAKPRAAGLPQTGGVKPGGAAQKVADIAASLGPPPKFAAPVNNPTSFDEIYAAAEIKPPAHGYTIFKVAEMLRSEHIRNLPAEVKRSSVLVALDAANVKLNELIEDAVRRDRALDAYERVQQRGLNELEALKTKENQQIQSEIDRLVAEHQAKIQANKDALAKARERFESWQKKKQEEEQRIADAVAPFVTENPVTTSATPARPAGAPPGSAQG